MVVEWASMTSSEAAARFERCLISFALSVPRLHACSWIRERIWITGHTRCFVCVLNCNPLSQSHLPSRGALTPDLLVRHFILSCKHHIAIMSSSSIDDA